MADTATLALVGVVATCAVSIVNTIITSRVKTEARETRGYVHEIKVSIDGRVSDLLTAKDELLEVAKAAAFGRGVAAERADQAALPALDVGVTSVALGPGLKNTGTEHDPIISLSDTQQRRIEAKP